MAEITTYYSAKVFPFIPNWEKGMKEKFVYPTDVLSSFNETEQRISLIETPVRTLSFRVNFMTALEAARFNALVYGWQHKLFAVPWWPMATELTAGVTTLDTDLPVDTRRFRLNDTQYHHLFVLLWAGPDDWEYVELNGNDTYDDESIEMYEPLLKDWPEGTICVPFTWARMASFTQPTDLITDVYAAADVSFESAGGGIDGWSLEEAWIPEEEEVLS